MQVSHDGKLHFIHRTFAEYYVADYLVKRLTEGNNTSQQLQTFILKDVFREAECRMIRVFMDAFLSRSELSKEALKQYGNRIQSLGEDCEMSLLNSAREGNAKITGMLIDSLEVAGHRDTLVKLLLAQGKGGKTSWHVAVEEAHRDVLEKLWECAKKVLNRDQLNINFLLNKGDAKMTALHQATFSGNVEILERIWKWANEQMSKEEVNKLLLAHDNDTKQPGMLQQIGVK